MVHCLFEIGGLVNSDRTEIQIIGQFVPLGNGVEVFVLLKVDL